MRADLGKLLDMRDTVVIVAGQTARDTRGSPVHWQLREAIHVRKAYV